LVGTSVAHVVIEPERGGQVVVTARTHDSDSGSAIPIVAASAGLRLGQSQAFSVLDDTAGLRTGYGFVETGGATTKVHLVVDALGLPLSFRITEGQRHDIVPAPELVRETRPRCLLGDKAYSTVAFRAELAVLGCVAVLPSSSSWIDPPAYDRELYKARTEIEGTFHLPKQARRYATRYEKTLRNNAAVVAPGCMLLWLRI
jgi:transposase